MAKTKKATKKKATNKKKTTKKSSRGRGRPTKIDDEEVLKKLVEAIREGATYEVACSYAGVSYRTFCNWRVKGEAARSGKFFHFFHAIKKAEADGAVEDLGIISKASLGGDWKAAAWRLERRHGYTKKPPKEELTPMTPQEEELLGITMETLIKAINDGDTRVALSLLVKLFGK